MHIVSLPDLRGAGKNVWRQEGCNEETKGDNSLTYRAVIATALLGPDRPRDSDLPLLPPFHLFQPSRTYLRPRLQRPRFFARLIIAPNSMIPRYPLLPLSNEKYERFHKASRRLQTFQYHPRCYNHRSVSEPRWKHCSSFRSTSIFSLVSSDVLAHSLYGDISAQTYFVNVIGAKK